MEIKVKAVLRTLDTLNIEGVYINIDKSAYISCILKNEDGLYESYNLVMDAETYAGWGSDDNYVINWVMKELGLEKP
jgi:hypothetical protein